MTWTLQDKQKILDDLLLIVKEHNFDIEYYESLAKKSLRNNAFFETFTETLAVDLDEKLEKESENILYSVEKINTEPVREVPVETPKLASDGEERKESTLIKIPDVTPYHYTNKLNYLNRMKGKIDAVQNVKKVGKVSLDDFKAFTIRRRVGASTWAYYFDKDEEGEFEELELSLTTQPILEEFEGVSYQDSLIKSKYEPENILEFKGRIEGPITLDAYPDLKLGDEQTAIGCDIARYGADSTTIFVRQGIHQVDLQKFVKTDLMSSCGYIVQAIREWRPKYVNVEVTGGIGAGIVDRLLEMGVDEITNICGIETQGQQVRYPKLMAFNVRSEMFVMLQERFRAGLISISPHDEDLAEEIVNVKYKILSDGKIKILENDEIKKAIGRSPDKAIACSLAYYEPVDIGLW